MDASLLSGPCVTARVSLSRLAGEWYDWWLARHVGALGLQVERWRDAVQNALKSAGLSTQYAELWGQLLGTVLFSARLTPVRQREQL